VKARAALALLAFALAACSAPRGRAPDLRAPREAAPLGRDQALAVALANRSSERAIQTLETRRLGFPLDRANVEWLRIHGAPPEVVLYLKQRANAEWRERVAEDRAEAPEVEDYAPPSGHGGDGDFAGVNSGFGSNGIERPVYVRGTPGSHYAHALTKAPAARASGWGRAGAPVPS